MIEVVYSFIDDMLTIKASMTVYGINETYFVSIKPMLVDIITGITNSSATAVDVHLEYEIFCAITVKPADESHEKYVISKLEDTIYFLHEINLGIQNQTNGSNLTVSNIGHVFRVPGLRIYVEVF